MAEFFDAWAGQYYVDEDQAAALDAITFKQADNAARSSVPHFASVAARNSARTAWSAAHPTLTARLKATVEGRGMCFYDGNTRSGSNGWTWVAQNNLVVDITGESGYSAVPSPSTEIVAVTVPVVGGPRALRISLDGDLRDSSINPLVSTVGARMFITVNGGEYFRLQAKIEPGQGGLSVHSVGKTRVIRATADVAMSVRILREAGSGGGVEVNGVCLQVTDLGPVD